MKYALDELPRKAAIFIARKAYKRAGWKVVEGEWVGGSTMLLEWLSFIYTPERWIEECESWQIQIPEKLKKQLLDMVGENV